jgi:ABC-type multidrug transport system ATPase subunit
MANAIRLTDVTKRFNGVAAVDGLTLAVPDGSIYGFIGPNGSGKTTTLRMIMHLLLPDQGQIEVLGTAATAAARDRVSYPSPKSAVSTRRWASGACSATTGVSRDAASRSSIP